MCPFVQSVDLCTLHPVRAVTAHDKSGFTKLKSVIQVGDVVFCKPQPLNLDYAHLVVSIDYKTDKPVTYRLWNIKGHVNERCHKKHIFGILVAVQVFHDDNYISRPCPQEMYHEVRSLLAQGTDSAEREAERLCLPRSVHDARR